MPTFAALEYILRVDTRPTLNVMVANYPGILNAEILEPDSRRRLRFVKTERNADYFVGNYRDQRSYRYPNEIHSIRVDGSRIVVVYDLRKPPG